jgi:hypothetical protein
VTPSAQRLRANIAACLTFPEIEPSVADAYAGLTSGDSSLVETLARLRAEGAKRFAAAQARVEAFDERSQQEMRQRPDRNRNHDWLVDSGPGQEWNSDFTRRLITNVSIHRGDVSLVNQASNPATTATVIERDADLTFERRKLLADRIGTHMFAPKVGMSDERRNAMLDAEADAKRVAIDAKMERFRARSPLVKDGDSFDRIKRSWQARLAESRGADAERTHERIFERRLADERAATEREARSLGVPGWRDGDNPIDEDVTTVTTVCPECGASLAIELPDEDEIPQETAESETGDGMPSYTPKRLHDGQP